MSNSIRYIDDKDGNHVLPVTHERAVKDSSGVNLETKLAGLNSRPYDSQTPNGMGYLVLEKDKTFASQVTDTNTIYEIRNDFDLDNTAFTLPSGCSFLFNGGRLLNSNLTGSVLNTELKPEWFGAAADGTTDDSTPIEACVKLAIASGATVVFDGTKEYICSTSKTISISRDLTIKGGGAKITVTNYSLFNFQAALVTSVQSPTNLVRKATSISFSTLPTGIEEGDIIQITSTETGESSYNTKRNQATRVGRINGTTIYLSDPLVMDFTAANTTLYFYHPHRVVMDGLLWFNVPGGSRAIAQFGNIIPIFDRIDFDGAESSFGIHLTGCVDGIVTNCTVHHVTYGYLVNSCSHILFDGIFGDYPANHPVAIATFSNYITVRRVTGVGELIESHTGFNITYEDCHFCGKFNIRAVGLTMRRCSVKSSDGSPIASPLIASVALYDTSIYNDYNALFEDCEFDLSSITVNNSSIIEFNRCTLYQGALVNFGAASASIVNKGIIKNSPTITAINYYKNNFEFESDREVFDAVLDSGVYKINLALASFKYTTAQAEWHGHGKITDVDTTASLTVPVTLYPQRGTSQTCGSGELYINFEFTIYSTNRANTISFSQKTYRAIIAFFPLYGSNKLVRLEDLSPDETDLSATVTDLTTSGGTSNPSAQTVSFNINYTSSIASASAARNTVTYECSIVGRNW